MVRWFICAGLATMLCTSCDVLDIKGMFVPTSDMVNTRFEESMELTEGKSIAHIEAEESYQIYVCADTHIDDAYNNLREFTTLMRNNPEAPFGIVLGDCIDRRNVLPRYLEGIEHDAESLPYNTPIFSVLGNHDLYFSQWDKFRELVGPSVYWFEVAHPAGKDIFISLDTASGTLGIRQTEWLREFLAHNRQSYRHCVIITHTNIFYNDNSQNTSGNLPLDETMLLLDLFDKHDVLLCLQGHDHHRDDLTFRGVRYTIVGTLRDEAEAPEYLTIRISADALHYNWVDMK